MASICLGPIEGEVRTAEDILQTTKPPVVGVGLEIPAPCILDHLPVFRACLVPSAEPEGTQRMEPTRNSIQFRPLIINELPVAWVQTERCNQ
jgi:hypothetical protein